jgi:hypothetical protein
MTHWALRYIGKPWAAGTAGPDTFDCWGLVVEVQKQLFNRTLETVYIAPDDLRGLIQALEHHPFRKEWEITQTPHEGDVVLLRQSRHPVHVGVWLEVDGGGVLHATRSWGVIFQRIPELNLSGWQIENIYTYTGKSNDCHGHPSSQSLPASPEP